MRSPPDPTEIPNSSGPSHAVPVPLLDGGGWLRLLALLALFAATIVAISWLAGCVPAQLKSADTAAHVCQTVQRVAGSAVYAWEADREGPIVLSAESATTGAGIAIAKEQLQVQRQQLQIATGVLDGLDAACTTLANAVKLAREQSGGGIVPDDIVQAVWSAVAKVVKVLIDLGVKVPPGLVPPSPSS